MLLNLDVVSPSSAASVGMCLFEEGNDSHCPCLLRSSIGSGSSRNHTRRRSPSLPSLSVSTTPSAASSVPLRDYWSRLRMSSRCMLSRLWLLPGVA